MPADNEVMILALVELAEARHRGELSPEEYEMAVEELANGGGDDEAA